MSKNSSGKLTVLSFLASRLCFDELLVLVELKRSEASCIFIDNGFFNLADKPERQPVAGIKKLFGKIIRQLCF